MTGQPLKQEDDRINESPLVRVLQRHFRRRYEHSAYLVSDITNKETQKQMLDEHAPTPLSNPFWNSNGVKEQEER